MSTVYIPVSVARVQTLHDELLKVYPGEWSVRYVLDRQAQRLLDAFHEKNDAVVIQLSNGHPQYADLSWDELAEKELELEDMRLAVAREHGYRSWKEVIGTGARMLDATFERSVDLILSGNSKELEQVLWANPDIVTATSPYAHGSTLLHYLAANGVEIWRQQVPGNADAIARLLIHHGADVQATASVYGGMYTTLELLLTSAHPGAAGISDALADVLRDAPAHF